MPYATRAAVRSGATRARSLVVVLTLAAFGCGGASSPTAPGGTPPPPAGPAQISGAYTFTYTASAACAAQLPADFRSRAYQATITQTDAQFAVNLAGDFSGAVFTGTVSGTRVSFTWAFAERVSGGFLVGPAFTASGTVAGSAIQGTMSGTLQFNPLSGANRACTAADHAWSFTRR